MSREKRKNEIVSGKAKTMKTATMKTTMACRRQMKTTTTMTTMPATDAVVQIFSCATKVTSATTT